MAKGYWIARVDVEDLEQYQRYASQVPEILTKYGGRYIARGGQTHALEGKIRARNVIIEFDSPEKALACYQSAEYQAARKFRENVSEGEFCIVEGL